jgi:hypothetical protein
MKLKAIVSILFLVFISIISSRTYITKADKLVTGPGKTVSHSVTMSVARVGVWH